MAKANARLRVTFDLDLLVPDAMASLDRSELAERLGAVLGATVLKGMPTVTTKQLAKAGIELCTSRHLLEAEGLASPTFEHAAVMSAAPHLTDAEVDALCRQPLKKKPPANELPAYIRRLALQRVNEYRLVPCHLRAIASGGETVELAAHLNLTNGGVLVDDAHRKTKLKTGQPEIAVTVDGADITLSAHLGGHTLGGPLLEVAICAIAPHRSALLECWEAQKQAAV
ncbi:MAG: hypothetical protein KDE68_08510 [Rhodocyclaceae bacterium]|nr:hypothetical protein [Rhodocyclaceae bacterium]